MPNVSRSPSLFFFSLSFYIYFPSFIFFYLLKDCPLTTYRHKAHLAHNARADTDAQDEGEGLAKRGEEVGGGGGVAIIEKENEEKSANEAEVSDVSMEDDNEATEKTKNPEKQSGEFYDMDMAVDEGKFDANSGDVDVGKFVSFYYAGQLAGRGPPINPKVLHHPPSLLLYPSPSPPALD